MSERRKDRVDSLRFQVAIHARERSTTTGRMCIPATLLEIAAELHTGNKLYPNLNQFSEAIGEKDGLSYGTELLSNIRNGSNLLGLHIRHVYIANLFKHFYPVPQDMEGIVTIGDIDGKRFKTPHLRIRYTNIDGEHKSHAEMIKNRFVQILDDRLNDRPKIVVVEFKKNH